METDNFGNFNETKLKRSLVNFERKCEENQKLRIKHVDEPTKFAASEIELFAALDEIQGVAVQPELYHVLFGRKSSISALMSLLAHDNTDISAKVVRILLDLIDYDDDQERPSDVIVKALLDCNLIDLLLSNLKRLDASVKEEAQCMEDSLEVIDMLIDYDKEAVTFNSQPLLQWMVKQLNHNGEFRSYESKIAEVLTIIVSGASEAKLHLCEAGGMDVLLRRAAKYRQVAPQHSEEDEFLSQVFNCLSVAVLNCDEARESFFKEEGVDLVELILREKRGAVKASNIKMSTLQMFSYVVSTDKTRDPIVTQCCERFVEVLGLRVLFPIFNNPRILLNDKVKQKSEYSQFIAQVEEHASAILLAMLKYVQNEEYTQRILIKFAEADFAKFERALALHDKYFKIVQNQDVEDEEAKRSMAYCNLKSIDYIILLVMYLSEHFEIYDPVGGETFANYIRKILKLKPQFRYQIILEVRKYLDEVADNVEEQNSLELLLKKFQDLRPADAVTNKARQD